LLLPLVGFGNGGGKVELFLIFRGEAGGVIALFDEVVSRSVMTVEAAPAPVLLLLTSVRRLLELCLCIKDGPLMMEIELVCFEWLLTASEGRALRELDPVLSVLPFIGNGDLPADIPGKGKPSAAMLTRGSAGLSRPGVRGDDSRIPSRSADARLRLLKLFFLSTCRRPLREAIEGLGKGWLARPAWAAKLALFGGGAAELDRFLVDPDRLFFAESRFDESSSDSDPLDQWLAG
jgi:hypothetical protein